MEGGNACAVGGLAAHLVSRDKNVGAVVGACCLDVRPAAVFITVCEGYPASAVALNNDCGAAGFVVRYRLVFTAAKF